ncbi:MAG TPA: hypothetical protein VFG07_08795, partial [Thermoplasmata archaeon]|nr:hypothetical protein [Thermoplasmata archaeon]
LGRASRLVWDRRFDEALFELKRSTAQGRSPSPGRAARMRLLAGEADRELADIQRNQGNPSEAIQTLKGAARRFRSLLHSTESRTRVRDGLGRTLTLLGELESFHGDQPRGERDLRNGLEVLRELTELPGSDWTVQRNYAVGQVALAQVRILRGDFQTAVEIARGARRRLEGLELGPGQGLPSSGRANLIMNQGRAVTVEAVGLHLESREGNAAISVGRRLALRAVRASRGTNPVMWRRLGIASRVQLAMLATQREVQPPLQGLAHRGRRAFLRSLALSPAEPDTLYEYARLLRLSSLCFPRRETSRGAKNVTSELRELLASADRLVHDHPARWLDPWLDSSRRFPPQFDFPTGALARWLLPSC